MVEFFVLLGVYTYLGNYMTMKDSYDAVYSFMQCHMGTFLEPGKGGIALVQGVIVHFQ
jgi:lipoprotein NlpI